MSKSSRRQQSFSHGKDPSLNEAASGNGATSFAGTTPTTPTETAATTVVTTTEVVTAAELQPVQNTTRRPYPVKPSTIRSATSYSLFSDPDAFQLSNIYSQTHYLAANLKGKIWWDVNGDSKRGDWSNATLNTQEYDYGIANVAKIYLVSCDDDAKESGSTRSMPYNDEDATPLKQSLSSNAGIYEFYDLDSIKSGRYYVMYMAPQGWRMSGNVLPLERRAVEDSGEEEDEYHECIPKGGNGEEFSEMAREVGDFDHEGYCARSIGCIEIGSRSELEEKFSDLETLESTQYYQDVIQGDTEPNPYGMSSGMAYTGGKWVAMPAPHVLDVGMSQAEWPLVSQQLADATVTLQFPVTAEGRRLATRDSLEVLLSEYFANAESFGTSENSKAMKKVLEKYVRDNIGNLGSGGKVKSESQEFADRQKSEIFAFSGVDLFDAKMERKKKNRRDSIGANLRRYLRGSRRTQEEEEEVLEVTYTFTARGTYKPPPHEQLGYFVQNSINANPDKLGRTLREDPDLPFKDLSEASSSHLTVGPPPPKPCEGCLGIQSNEYQVPRMERWATISIALLSVMIASLVVLFLGRRVWKRRRVVIDSDVQLDMETRNFTVGNDGVEKDVFVDQETSKKKSKKRKSSASDASAESNPQGPSVDEEHHVSSSSSEDTEERRRRRRSERKKDSRRRSKRKSQRAVN